MRVTITDKEALRALSWAAVRAYLEAAGWQRADDVPGKADVYQHTDKNGRLWEILVLLRDDLADYVSRMGDAVSTLARVEDRSELDVYEDLSTSAEATAHKVHQRVRKWLTEEHWHVDDVPIPPESFNIVAVGLDGQAINIYQHKEFLDHIALSLRWSYERVQQKIGQLDEHELRDVMWSIYRDAVMMGIEPFGIDTPSTSIMLRTHLYFDGLTKDTLMQRIQLVNRAYTLAMQTLIRALEARGHSDPSALSSEDLRRIMRPVPETGDLLTAAS